MKTKIAERKVTVNAGQRSEFKTGSAAKIINMLISGLYENKPQSITREIWSNARDAHVDAGTPERPFDVTFPSVFDPTFRVRDYGPGMSHEMIMDTYTTLGESTKEDSNDGVGKFGIGSKSPFSYTDTFSVVAYDGTTARYYTAIIESGGIPSMNMMAETPSDAEPGIEVSFPVDTGDVRAFRRAAQRVSYGFDVKPNVINDDEFEGWIDPPVVTEGDGWKLLSAPLEGYGGTAYAKMGCVLYPINAEALDHLSEDESSFLKSTVIIEFPIGDLEITPSREALSYGRNEPTAESITKRVRKIVTEVVDGILADYEKCETMWDAVSKYRQHIRMNLPNCILSLVTSKAQWRGQALCPYITFSRRNNSAYRALDFCLLAEKVLNRRTICFDRYQDQVDVAPSDKTVMIIEDLSLPPKKRVKRPAARIRQFAQKEGMKQVIWVRYHGSGKAEAEAMVALDTILEGIRIEHVNDLEEPERTHYTGPRAKVRRMGESPYRDFQETVELSSDEMDEGGIYIRLVHNQPQYPSRLASPHHMVRVLRQMGAIDADACIYGVPKTLWKSFEGEQWVDLYDLAKETYEETDCVDAAIRARAISTIRQNSLLRSLAEYLDLSKVAPKSGAAEAVAFYNGVKNEDTSQASPLLDFVRAMGDEDALQGDVPEVAEMEFYTKLVEESYPLVEVICAHFYYSDRTKIVDKLAQYIYTCDVAAETIRHKVAAAA